MQVVKRTVFFVVFIGVCKVKLRRFERNSKYWRSFRVCWGGQGFANVLIFFLKVCVVVERNLPQARFFPLPFFPHLPMSCSPSHFVVQLLNLALEKQAIGRVHRLGQTRPVVVTKLVLKDSLETRILAMQRKQGNRGSGSSSVEGRSVG